LGLLIEKGIDINLKNDEGYTALHIAAMRAGNPEILEQLVRAGADKTVTTEFGESAYDLASENELLANRSSNLEFLYP
ncbi:MAG: ankyrin repeat domain-containing protein, partial [Owenweeksia sp.]